MTCRYQHHCQLIAPCKYKCSLDFELEQPLSKSTQQAALLITCRLIICRLVMTSNIVLSGLLTNNSGMLAAIHTNTHRDCKTSLGYYPLHDHCVTTAYLCLDKSIRHGCCDLHQHGGQVVIGLFACRHGGVPKEHPVRAPAHVVLVYQCQQRSLLTLIWYSTSCDRYAKQS